MARHATFHVFDWGTYAWPDVMPGDGLVSPGTVAYNLDEFPDRGDKTKVYHLRKAPLLVLAICPYVPSSRDPHDDPEQMHAYRTYVMMSRHGLICAVMKVTKDG